MVSNISTKLFGAKKSKTVSSTPSSQPSSKAREMVLIPTVTVQEIEVPPSSNLTPPTSEISVEILPENLEEEIKGEPLPMPPNEPDFQQKLAEIRLKFGEIAAFLRNFNWVENADDLKSIWNIFAFVFVGFCTLFTFLAVIRAIFWPTEVPDEGWFCRYFAGPFSPLFNALCHQTDPVFFAHRIPFEMSILADQIGHGISQFFATLASGFSVFGTLFSAIWIGITDNLSFGCHELGENLGENVSYLIRFIAQIIHLVFNLIFSTIANFADLIAQVANSIHDYFQPPESSFW